MPVSQQLNTTRGEQLKRNVLISSDLKNPFCAEPSGFTKDNIIPVISGLWSTTRVCVATCSTVQRVKSSSAKIARLASKPNTIRAGVGQARRLTTLASRAENINRRSGEGLMGGV